MRIAILGAGFAGLGTAYHLLNQTKGNAAIDLFDPAPIGGGVSGLSAGLLHPFPGKRAEKIKNGENLLLSTHHLITEASKGLNQSVILSNGILRPAVTDQQIESFKKTADTYPRETEWWDQKKALDRIPGLYLPENGGALFIKNGVTLDVKAYLEGLWQISLRFGLHFHQRLFTDEAELAKYDKVVFATGMGLKQVGPVAHLPLAPVKGQLLRLKWPENLPPLPFSLISEGFVVMEKGNKTCMVGATFERQFKTEEPDLATALPHIKERIKHFFPSLINAEILECKAGIRATSLNQQPLLGKFLDKYWYITGLGSKGLLYHAYLGELLAKAILNDDPEIIHLPLT